MMATPQSSTLAKGLRLFRALARDGGRANLTTIARREAIPLATAHRLAVTLEAEGFIARLGKGCFAVGDGVRSIFPDRPDALPQLVASLRQRLERIAKRHAVILHFGVLEEGMVTYLIKAAGTQADLFTTEGMQLEAYCTAIGKVLLAALPPAALDAYLGDGPFVALTPNTLTDPAALRIELDGVRKSAIAHDRFEVHEQLYCLAIPVKDRTGRVVGGMSASFPGYVPGPEQVRPLLRSLRRLGQATAHHGVSAG